MVEVTPGFGKCCGRGEGVWWSEETPSVSLSVVSSALAILADKAGSLFPEELLCPCPHSVPLGLLVRGLRPVEEMQNVQKISL